MAEWGSGQNDCSLVWKSNTLTFPINPNAITWRTTMVASVHQVYRGRHFQPLKTYATGGRLVINTGADSPNRMGGKRLKDAITKFIADWMYAAVYNDAPPIQLLMPDLGINLKIWITEGPEEGALAATPSYTVTINFDIVQDEATPQDLSGETRTQLPFYDETGKEYTTLSGDTAAKIARKLYGNENLAFIITQAPGNKGVFDSQGNVLYVGVMITVPDLSALGFGLDIDEGVKWAP